MTGNKSSPRNQFARAYSDVSPFFIGAYQPRRLVPLSDETSSNMVKYGEQKPTKGPTDTEANGGIHFHPSARVVRREVRVMLDTANRAAFRTLFVLQEASAESRTPA